MKRIIIQGDDWGYSKESNAGIGYAYEYGILTSTTIMVNLLDQRKKSEHKDEIDHLENKSGLKKPKLGLGVHLNVTFGKPLSPKWPCPEFTRPYKGSGKPEEWIGSAWKKYFSQFKPEQIEDEYRRQVELALTIFENIDHLDSHHFSAAYEPLKTIYEKLAKEYKLAVRPAAPLSEKPAYGGDFITSKEACEDLKARGIKTADKYILKLFFNEKNPLQSFLDEIDTVMEDEITEAMFHPAKGERSDEFRKIDLGVLTDQRTLDYFAKNIELITYKSL